MRADQTDSLPAERAADYLNGEMELRRGSFFIGGHMGMDAQFSVEPEVVPVPQLGLLNLLQRAHQVKQVVPVTDPRDRRKPAARRSLSSQTSGRPQLPSAPKAPAKTGAKAFFSHRQVAATPKRPASH